MREYNDIFLSKNLLDMIKQDNCDGFLQNKEDLEENFDYYERIIQREHEYFDVFRIGYYLVDPKGHCKFTLNIFPHDHQKFHISRIDQSLNSLDGKEALDIIKNHPECRKRLMWEKDNKIYKLRIWTIVINDLNSKGRLRGTSPMIFEKPNQYSQRTFAVYDSSMERIWQIWDPHTFLNRDESRIHFQFEGEISTYYLHYDSLYVRGYLDVNSFEFHYECFRISSEILK